MIDYPHNIVIKVGEGQSPSGKILDRGTHWYNVNEYKEALQYANETNRNIYLSFNKKKYLKYSKERLIELIEKLHYEYSTF